MPTGPAAAFAQDVAQWHDFFALAGGAAATLLGLVFVALSLNPQVMADEHEAGVQAWSGQAYSNFLGVLFIALTGMIPNTTPLTIGLAIAVSAAIGIWRSAVRLRLLLTHPDPEWRGRHHMVDFVLYASGYLILAFVATDVLTGSTDSLFWLIPAVFLLIWSAMKGCWDLLIEMGRRRS